MTKNGASCPLGPEMKFNVIGHYGHGWNIASRTFVDNCENVPAGFSSISVKVSVIPGSAYSNAACETGLGSPMWVIEDEQIK